MKKIKTWNPNKTETGALWKGNLLLSLPMDLSFSFFFPRCGPHYVCHNVGKPFHFDPEGSSNLQLLLLYLLRFSQMKPGKQNLNSQALWSKRKKNLVLIPFSPSLHIQTFPQIATHCQPPKVTSSFHFTWNLSLKTRTFLKLPAGRHYSKVLFIPQFWQFWGSPSDSKRWF